jgi:hypothetical protein
MARTTEIGRESTSLTGPIFIILPYLIEAIVPQHPVVEVCTGVEHIVDVLLMLALERQLQDAKPTFHHSKGAFDVFPHTFKRFGPGFDMRASIVGPWALEASPAVVPAITHQPATSQGPAAYPETEMPVQAGSHSHDEGIMSHTRFVVHGTRLGRCHVLNETAMVYSDIERAGRVSFRSFMTRQQA